MRVDEQEIPGASDCMDDAPSIFEARTSKRGRVPKRGWPEVEASKPRKKRQRRALPTPDSTQTSTQTSTQANSFTIYQNEPTADQPLSARQNDPKKQDWELEFEERKKESKKAARDYLVQLIGNDEYPEVLRVPTVTPEVLIKDPFLLEDPLAIWRKFIGQEDLGYIANHTNKNAADDLKQQDTTTQPHKRP